MQITKGLKTNEISFKKHIKWWLNGGPWSKFGVWHNELKDLKEKYVDLMKQQESTLLDMKAYEEGLRCFDFICKTYEDKLKFSCHKLQEKCNGKPLSNHCNAPVAILLFLVDFNMFGVFLYENVELCEY